MNNDNIPADYDHLTKLSGRVNGRKMSCTSLLGMDPDQGTS